jgi:dienelactone hydrolase
VSPPVRSRGVGRSLRVIGLAAAFVSACASAGVSPRVVQFQWLDQTRLDGHLVIPRGEGRHPALVFLHGCGGLVSSQRRIQSRETDWASRLTALGYVVLMGDSFSPRGIARMCSQARFDRQVYLARPKDAYGALHYLQAQDFVRPDRIGIMGWSQGGGVVLTSIRKASLGRRPELAQGDFRAAVAFYPASCREGAHRVRWTSAIPLLVLVGAEDVWTPAAPCRQLVENAIGRGSNAEMEVYPGAYHDFDWPNLPVHAVPPYRTAAGIVPIIGTNPAARKVAIARVTEFLARYLLD